MKKVNNRGFILAETLIVTSFVAGVLVFLFIQFTNLSKNYEDNYKYNTVESLYALEDVKYYILEDTSVLKKIKNELADKEYIDMSCDMFSDSNYCLKLFELENIDQLIVSKNSFNKSKFNNQDENLSTFVKKISIVGNEKYRLIASFKNSTYATLRFGE